MLLYLTIYSFSVISLLLLNGRTIGTKINLSIIGFVITIIVGFRAESVGTDTRSYIEIFNYISNGYTSSFINERVGGIYYYLNWLTSYCGFSVNFIFIVTAFLSIYLIFSGVAEKSSCVFISIVIFFALDYFFYMHNIVRQACAVAVIFYAVTHFKDRSVYFFISIIIAIQFHFTSLIFVGFYVLSLFNFKAKTLAYIWIFSVLYLMFSKYMINLSDVLVNIIPNQYSNYLSSEVIGAYEERMSLGFGFAFRQAICIFLIFSYDFFKKNCHNFNPDQKFGLQMILLSIFSITFFNVSLTLGLLNRLSLYPGVFLILSIPFCITNLFSGYSRMFVYLGFALLCSFLYLFAIRSQVHGIFPYESILYSAF